MLAQDEVRPKREVQDRGLPAGGREEAGQCRLLAEERDGRLIYVGKAGSGVTMATGRDLEALRRPKQPCDGNPSTATRRKARWAEPKLLTEVEYRGITADGELRHPVFKRRSRDSS
jgi:bifunctional non-homologous end joining protein LigD